jgi:toxin-antitoxin system PIN domain toxin
VIAVDTQILVYAHRRDSVWHERARERVGELASSGARWAIPLHCLVEVYTNVTRPIRPDPTPPDIAIAQIDRWLESPSLTVLAEDQATWPFLRDLLRAARIVGPAAYDARIAAVCIQHGVTELWTADRDFLSYPTLRVRNPLVDIQPTRASEARATYQVKGRRRSRRR